ncbi:hypothetical protein [uncultured Desulfosarcina sp.]|uniref:hypothetical protein n=1 Tax=uncultured Desulfosarcina sp. TaxID=218289 RepID=UPI0029C69137|nr:hypothetical protein [uncultured Desulfosarcina sp.]
MEQSPLIRVDLSVGGMLLGIPLAVDGYIIAFRIIRHHRKAAVGLLGATDVCHPMPGPKIPSGALLSPQHSARSPLSPDQYSL